MNHTDVTKKKKLTLTAKACSVIKKKKPYKS